MKTELQSMADTSLQVLEAAYTFPPECIEHSGLYTR